MINQSNYETWLLLYADEELSTEERTMVLQFVEQHPEMKNLLEMLMQIRFRPDADVQFPDKSILTKHDREIAEDYRFEPDLSITFPDKLSLYRKSVPVLSLLKRGISAAAGLILISGLFWLLMQSRDNKGGSTSMSQGSQVKSVSPENKEVIKKPGDLVSDDNIKGTKVNIVGTRSPKLAKSTVAVVSLKEVESVPLSNKESVAVQKTIAEEISIDKMMIENSEIEKENDATVNSAAISRSNFTEEALASAREKEVVTAMNTEVFIQAAIKDVKNTPFKGLIRKINRRVLHEKDQDEGQRYIRVAVFNIPVQKKQN